MLTAAVSLGVLAGYGSKETVSDTTADKVSQSSGQAAAEESTVENTEESKTITFPLEEKMTFTAFTVDYDGTDLSERAAFQKFMEDNNIEIEFTSALQEELKEIARKGILYINLVKECATMFKKYCETEIVPRIK